MRFLATRRSTFLAHISSLRIGTAGVLVVVSIRICNFPVNEPAINKTVTVLFF